MTNAGTIKGSAGFGVELSAGGSVNNGAAAQTYAYISGATTGLYVTGATGSVTNNGMIEGVAGAGIALADGGAIRNSGTLKATGAGPSATGVDLFVGGSVYNAQLGKITGYVGLLAGGAATIQTSGSIVGSLTKLQGAGVELKHGGTITNGHYGLPAALIEGYDGVKAVAAAATIVNSYHIVGAGGVGVAFEAGGNVENAANHKLSLISGVEAGVSISGSCQLTVTNAGTISGSAGFGVELSAGGSVMNQAGGVDRGRRLRGCEFPARPERWSTPARSRAAPRAPWFSPAAAPIR